MFFEMILFSKTTQPSFFRLENMFGFFVPPYFASVILWSCDDSVTFVVKLAWKDLIFMTFQHLKLLSSLHVPKSGSVIETSW